MKYLNGHHTHQVLCRWVNEVQKPMSYIEDHETKVIHIYTKYPGYFIGRYGETVNRYRTELREIGWDNVDFFELTNTILPRKIDTQS